AGAHHRRPCARRYERHLRAPNRLGRQFITENKTGAAGNIAAEYVVNAAPDGYTLLVFASPAAINATLYANLNFNFKRLKRNQEQRALIYHLQCPLWVLRFFRPLASQIVWRVRWPHNQPDLAFT